MSKSPPFIDQPSSSLNTDQIIQEAIPLFKLIGLVALVALFPLGVAILGEYFLRLFMLIAQFVLAVGSAIVLLYVIARGIQLAE